MYGINSSPVIENSTTLRTNIMSYRTLVSVILLSFYFTHARTAARTEDVAAKSYPVPDKNTGDEGEVADLTLKKSKVKHLFEEYWNWKLVNNPQLATNIGLTIYGDRVNEMSLSSYKRREDQVKSFLDRLDDLKKTANYSESLFDIDLLQEDLQQYLQSSLKFKSYLFPINNMEGPHFFHINLISSMKKTTESDMRNIITRLRLFAQQIDEMITLLREGIRLGLTMHRRSFQRLNSVYKKFSTIKNTKSPFFAPFKIEKPKKISNATWNDILRQAAYAIQHYTQPSYKRLKAFLKNEYLPKSRSKIGVGYLPNGFEYYQACLRFHTTTDLSAYEIHEIGLKEIRRITQRMEMVKKQVNFNGTLNEFRRYLRTSEKFGFRDEKDMLIFYRNLKKNITDILPKYVGKQTTTPLEIEPVPSYLAANAAFAYYEEPSGDGKRPGIFRLNTYKPRNKRKYVAVAVFLHEALPGHHTQIAWKLQYGSPVSFRRFAGSDALYYETPATFASNNAYIEGWALYCEHLGEEMGLYKNPYDLLGRLSSEMLRAARLVVDTGMHVLKWSRKKAIKFMAQNTADDMDSILSEVDRYITWPGQACSYKIGELKIKELRSSAEERLGPKFDLREFHDFIISLGNIPLTVLGKQVHMFVSKKLNSTTS